MNVLIVNTYHYLRGGDCRLSIDMGKLLKNNGHEVHYFAMQGKNNIPCPDEHYFISDIDYVVSLHNKSLKNILKVVCCSIFSREAKSNISILIDDIKPDIVHLHSIRHHLTKSILSEISKRNIPTVWTLHDYKELCPNTNFHDGWKICEDCKNGKFLNVIRNRCKKGSFEASIVTYLEAVFNSRPIYESCIDKYISPSRFLRNKFIDAGYDPGKFVCQPNFLHVKNYTPHYEHENYYLYLGRLENIKGVRTLVDAFLALPDHLNGLRLKIAGTGSLKIELQSQLKTLATDRIEVLGYLKGKRLEKVIQNAKAIVIPSEWYENYPYSVLEAMAYGKPVIASRIGGIPEIVDDNITGILFEPFECNNIVNAIVKFEKISFSEIKSMGKNAREKVEYFNSPEKYLESTIALYESLSLSPKKNSKQW